MPLPENAADLCTARELAERYGVPVRRIHSWTERHADTFPALAFRLGATHFYLIAEVDAWVSFYQRSVGRPTRVPADE